jgi:acetylornithine/succinyldiaminopimelate/putrescine aminotransferase
MAVSGGQEMQSGPGTDDSSFANIAWDDAVAKCKQLFNKHLLVATAHASDLFQYILAAHDVGQREQLSGATQIVSFPWHYYSMGFTAHTLALTKSVTFAFKVIEADATAQTDATELLALQQLRAAFLERRSICLIEPLCIPGKGLSFRPSFLTQVQHLCDELKVPLVADETLSAIRCGEPLLSEFVGLRPSYVMLGKAFGCALLLSTHDFKVEFAQAVSVMAPAYQILHLAFVLRFILGNNVAQQCKKQGEDLKQVLEGMVGAGNVRQTGLALWIDKHMERLPFASCVHGRLLPRIDQKIEQLQQFLEQHRSMMATIIEMGAAGRREGRLFCCAVCSVQNGQLEECQNCLRVYHRECRLAACCCS